MWRVSRLRCCPEYERNFDRSCGVRDNPPVSSLVLSLIAALGYGLSDFLGGLGARRVHVLRIVLVSYPVGLVGLLLVAPLAGGTLTAPSVLLAMCSGIANGLAIIWFYSASPPAR